MRRITTGQTGDPLLGKLRVDDNELSPLAAGDSLELSGNTVEVSVNFDVTGGNGVRIYEGSNYVDLNAPSLSSNVNFTLPSDTGTSGYVLRTDGSGNLSWVDVSFEVFNQTADTATYYPLMSTSSSGSITGVSTSTSKLSFQPSSGTLSVDNVDINGGSIDGVSIGSNSAATGTFSSVDINGGSIDGVSIGSNSAATGSFSTVDINGGSIDGTTIGANSAANGTFDSLTANSITETSSLIFKENIRPLEDSLSTILKLEGVMYTRKQTGNEESGLIAEEVAKHIPSLIVFENNKPYGIAYSKLTAYLIESVKTLNEKIERLKNG